MFKEFLLARRLTSLVLVGNKEFAPDQGQDILRDQLVCQDNLRPGGNGLVSGHGQKIWIAGTCANEFDLASGRI